MIGLDGDTPGIRQGPFLPDAQGLPGLTHIVAGKHFTRCADIHALGLRRRDCHGVDIRIIQTRLDVRPGVATVQAAEDTVDFYAGPDNAMIVRSTMTLVTKGVPIEHSWAMSTANFSHSQSTIPRAIDPRRARAGKENTGSTGRWPVTRSSAHRPARQCAPTAPRHRGSRTAVSSTCENGLCLRRMSD